MSVKTLSQDNPDFFVDKHLTWITLIKWSLIDEEKKNKSFDITKDCGLIGHVDYKLSLTRFYMKGSFRGPRSFYPHIDVKNRLNLGANACRPNLLSYVDNTCRKDL